MLSSNINSISQKNKDKRYPFEGRGELAVSGSTGAKVGDSSPTPSRGYPFSGAGSKSLPEAPWGAGVGTAGGVVTSLVTPPGPTHTKPIPETKLKTTTVKTKRKKQLCHGGNVFQEICPHGNWRWRWAPCGLWSCPICRERRVALELVPEIRANMLAAKARGRTLKLLTLTWQGDDVGAADTRKGRKRRSLDLAHLVQYVRRGDKGLKGRRRRHPAIFEYMKIPELHKSGSVHNHLVADMPFINQKELSLKWKDYSRGSFIVDIRSIGMRCPKCWDRSASARERRRRMIIPSPGRGKCLNCGYEPLEVVLADGAVGGAAWEAGKYLGKAVVGKVTRSRGWVRDKPETLESVTPEPGSSDLFGDLLGDLVSSVEDEHKFTYVGEPDQLLESWPGLEPLLLSGSPCYPKGGAPCNCFKGNWVASAAEDYIDEHGQVTPAYKNGLTGLSRSPPDLEAIANTEKEVLLPG